MNKFPLTQRKDGRFCKKVKGRTYYFTGTAEEALREWLRVKDHLEAGEYPPSKPVEGEITVKQLCNEFLAWKLSLVESSDISERTHDYLTDMARFLTKTFPGRTVASLTPSDFARLRNRMAATWGPQTLANAVVAVRGIFKYGSDTRLISPPNYGPSFSRPKARVIRVSRASQRLMDPEEIRLLMEGGDVNLRAMILLGINGGLGDMDVVLLPVDLAAAAVQTGWLDYPRRKTGVPRRIPLWPETVEALKAALAVRRMPRKAECVGLAFVAPKRGGAYAHGTDWRCNRLPRLLKDAAEKSGLMGRYRFYDLRRAFQTVGEDANDLVAVQAIMGHAPKSNDMSARYRQRVTDARLLAVTNCIRRWLYETNETTGTQTS